MLLHRVLFIMAAVLFPSLSNVFGFFPKRLPPVHVCPALQGKGFSKESNDAPKLGKDAAKILCEAKGSLEVAQGIYFQSILKSLKSTDPEMYAKLEGYSPNNRDETSRQAHAKLVEYTWDTIAAYLTPCDIIGRCWECWWRCNRLGNIQEAGSRCSSSLF